MENPSTPNAVWIALAQLHKDNPDRVAFRVREIVDAVKRLHLQGNVTEETVRTHISSHCVANKPPRPDTHRKLVKLSQGMYRLYVDGDYFDERRSSGQTVPLPDMIPQGFHHLLDWYYNEYAKNKLARVSREGISVSVIVKPPEPIDEKAAEFASIDSNNLIKIPEKIMQSLNIKAGDHLGFILQGDRIIVKKAKAKFEL